MNVLKALLATISIFAVATGLTWIASQGTWGAITLFVVVFVGVFVALLGHFS